MYALPMLMEEFIRETWFLVKEDHGAEVGLLIRAVAVTADGEFGKCMLVDEMVWAWVDCCICGGVVACHLCCWWCGGGRVREDGVKTKQKSMSMLKVGDLEVKVK
jgi:hypothetical protein